jgi:hypothetical protein
MIKKKINPKYLAIFGAILVFCGYGLNVIIGGADVIATLFGILLGAFLFLIGIASLLSGWLKSRKS